MPGIVLHTLVILTHLICTTTISVGGIIMGTLPGRELMGTERIVGFLEAKSMGKSGLNSVYLTRLSCC